MAQGRAQEGLEVLERGDFSREGLAVGKESSQDGVLATDGQNSCSPWLVETSTLVKGGHRDRLKESKWPLHDACDTWKHGVGAHVPPLASQWISPRKQSRGQGTAPWRPLRPCQGRAPKPDLFSCTRWCTALQLCREDRVVWGCQRLTEGT